MLPGNQSFSSSWLSAHSVPILLPFCAPNLEFPWSCLSDLQWDLAVGHQGGKAALSEGSVWWMPDCFNVTGGGRVTILDEV